jgi:nucleotide-binding universal stress UspA family protein
MRDILALANKYGSWTRNMQYAGDLAASLGASLTGIHVSGPVPPGGAPTVYPELYNWTANVVREAIDAGPLFCRWAAGLGIKHAQWQVAEGNIEMVLAHAANWHDVLVLEAGKNGVWSSAQALGKILLTSGLPCIVVPEKSSPNAGPDTIAIAWNGSTESMRAVHAALPLLRMAGRVVLLYGERALPFSSLAWQPPLDVEQYLTRHEIKFTKRLFDASADVAGAELLRAAYKVQANLLVMGGYGRSRFSEWMLGGATLHILEHSDIPVLLRH